jgi:hypothetical protein
MTATMVFVHGRGQEFKDPAVLVRTWQAGLAAGLIKAGMAPLSDAPVVFPYYANLLYRITAHVARDPIELETLPAGPDPGPEPVLDLVREAIPPAGPIVLVSHSLGTVVARDLLDDAQIRDRATFWVTAGSPLGLDAVQKNLLTHGARNPGVPWLSAFDVHDIVALGHPLLPAWGPPLRDVGVDNGDNPHSIERYLNHPEVAGPIGIAVQASRSAPS